MEKWISALVFCLLFVHTASASILPASGTDESFKALTGKDCTPAVILCESLSVLDARGDQGGKKVETLYYSGQTIPVVESWDGYAQIYYADGKIGYVHNDYLLMDPSWYLCDEAAQVYAYPESMAPRVAYLEKGAMLPIITEYNDDSINGWVCVSLRGAAGWIRKTPADTASNTWFRPDMLAELSSARLTLENETMTCTDPALLNELALLLTHTEDKGDTVSGCPFTAALTLENSSGESIELTIATDSCCVYRVDGRDYAYARHLWTKEEGSPSNEVLFHLFGISSQSIWE